MATPASNPSHLLISRNPRSPAHPQLASTTTTSLYSPHPQPGPHLFAFDQASTSGTSFSTGAGAGPSTSTMSSNHPYGFAHTHGHGSPDPQASSYTVGVSSIAAPAHIRSHSTPAFPTSPDMDDADDEDEDDIVVHPTFCRDAALPGRVKVIVGRYEFWCHKEVLWFASPFFNALLQGCWAETSSAAVAPSPAAAGPNAPKLSSPTDTDPSHAERAREVPEAGGGGGEDPAAARLAVPAPAPTPTFQQPAAPERSQSSTPSANAATTEPEPSAQLTVLDPAAPISPRSSRSARSARRSRQSLGVESDDLNSNEHKASVYLDAEEGLETGPGPSVAEILRELREIPEPSGAALDVIEGRQEDDSAQLAQPAPSTSPSPSPLPISASPPRTPQSSNQSSLVPPERPRSAPTPSPAAPSSPPQTMSLSPPLPLRLQGMTAACPPTVTPASAKRASREQGTTFDPMVAAWPGRTAASPAAVEEREKNVEAVVELHEESPGAFQDFLFWAYPHLECKVTWTNVEGLLALSSKLIVPALQSLCERFLMTHASGRPIVALALAEQHGNAELYREASRFVLDQATWDAGDLEYLSEQTQLKLSQRRTWFLERLLKLGSIDPKKEYTCRPDCPDPSRCQAQLDEKWRQAHQAVSRYGPPQPSVAFRCLRQLETFPTNPSLVMPHPLCQTAAKSWVMTLFDRMFQPKMAFGAMSPGTEKYWLYITLT